MLLMPARYASFLRDGSDGFDNENPFLSPPAGVGPFFFFGRGASIFLEQDCSPENRAPAGRGSPSAVRKLLPAFVFFLSSLASFLVHHQYRGNFNAQFATYCRVE